MAEVFSIVSGALSVAALFNNAIDCFEYVQLGRSFEADYETCQIRLDIARLRLSRWGEAVDIHNNTNFTAINSKTEQARTAKRILEQVLKLFRNACEQSYDFKSQASEEDLAVMDPSTNINQPISSLRRILHALTGKRQRSVGLSKKLSWALYKKKFFTRLIDDIQELLDGLENILPLQESYRRLVEEEISEIRDERSLLILSEASVEVDELLRAAATERLEPSYGNKIEKAKVSDRARVKVGNEYITQIAPAGRSGRKSVNRIGDLDAMGWTKTHVGNSYGGRGFFDDSGVVESS